MTDFGRKATLLGTLLLSFSAASFLFFEDKFLGVYLLLAGLTLFMYTVITVYEKGFMEQRDARRLAVSPRTIKVKVHGFKFAGSDHYVATCRVLMDGTICPAEDMFLTFDPDWNENISMLGAPYWLPLKGDDRKIVMLNRVYTVNL